MTAAGPADTPGATRPPWGVALAVALAAFALYAATACPTFYWLDSSEFAAAAATLGISHPPGHAAEELVGRAFALLPLGSLAFRVNLASAALGAVAAGACFALAWRLADAIAGWRRSAVAAAAAVLFATGYAAWLQAARAEVYALEAALLIACLAAVATAATGRRPQALLLAGLLLGAGLANHHLSTLLLVAPTLVFVAARTDLRGPALWRAVLLAGLGAGLLLYLPLRAARAPVVDWGHPDRWSRFFWVVSARPFQKTAATRARFDLAGLGDAAALLFGELAVVPALLALIGLAGLWRRGRRGLAGYLAAAIACNVGAVLLTGFDPQNPDAYGYLLPSIAVGAALAAAGVAEIAATLTALRHGPLIAGGLAALALALAPLHALAGARAARLGSSWGADTYARAQLRLLPPRSLLLAGSFETVFNLWYLQAVEGARPDVDVVRRGFLLHPGYVEELAARRPELSPLARALRDSGARLPRAVLAGVAAQRPLFTELVPAVDLDGAGGALDLLMPVGPLFAVLPSPPPAEAWAADRAGQRRRATQLEARLGEDRDEPETAHALLWEAFVQAELDCLVGRRSEAGDAIAAAQALAPQDATLADLAQRCH